MITLKKIETKNEEKKALKLYKTAFPKEEQKPWKLLLKKQKEGLYNLSIAVDEENNFYDEKIVIPKIEEYIKPILTIIPLQLIAYNVAKLKGCNIDKPKNLAKSVTVE